MSTSWPTQDIDRVWASEEVVIVTVVGAGMRSTPGISGKIFSALGNSGVNVIAIAQGSSEVSISLVTDAASIRPAVQAVHSLIGVCKEHWRWMKKIPVAVLAATGSVGQRFVQLLDGHPWFEVVALTGSDRSIGRPYGEPATGF